MPLEDFINAEDKRASLEALRNRTFNEVYTLCIRLGIDTEAFDYETWELPERTDDNDNIYINFIMIKRMCETLKIIDLKIGK